MWRFSRVAAGDVLLMHSCVRLQAWFSRRSLLASLGVIGTVTAAKAAQAKATDPYEASRLQPVTNERLFPAYC
jgi:hypothetical protein